MSDWTVSLEPGRDTAAGSLCVWAASEGKPYIARITGRDTTYGWQRVFLKAERSYPSLKVNPYKIVRLVVPVRLLMPYPVALDIRWGPDDGPSTIDKKTGNIVKLCSMRGLFVVDSAGLRQVEERHVAWLLDERIVAPGPPRRPPDMRAKVVFDDTDV